MIASKPGFRSIVRERVMRRVVQACEYPVALIVAPAGYGKTVALRQYLQSLDPPQVRFDVRSEHETLRGFVRGFAEAVACVAPEIRVALGDALRGPSTAPQLAEWAAAHLREFHGVVAIDDLHLASDDGIAVFLRSLIERLKGQVHWVVASRSTPALPIATWMTYGDMDIAVDERDLAFTVDEAKEAGNETGASEEELRRFVQMTGGWATALSFAMRSRVRTSELEAIGHATRDMVYRYLAEQVYEQLNEVERQLLNLAAYMPVIDVDLLVAAGFTDAFALLEQLRKRTAFLSIEGQRTYRCHDLFRDFLRHQVQLQGREVACELQTRAANLLRASGQIALALRIYADMHADRDIVSILTDAGFELLDKGLWDSAEAAISVLSEDVRECDVAVLAIRASLDKHKGDFEHAERLLARAISSATDPLQKAELTIKLANLGFEKFKDIAPLLESLDLDVLPIDTAAEALGFLMACHARFGRAADARALLPRAEAFALDVTSEHVRAKLLHRCGIVAFELDEVGEKAANFFSEAISISIQSGFYMTATAAYGGSAAIALFANDDPYAYLDLTRKCFESAEKAGDVFSLHMAAGRVLDAQVHVGEFHEMPAMLEIMERTVVADRHWFRYVKPAQALVSAVNLRFGEAYGFACERDGARSFDRAYNAAMRAVYAHLAELHDAAIGACNAVLGILDSEVFTHSYARATADVARLFAALIYFFEGEQTTASMLAQRQSLTSRPYIVALSAVVKRFILSNCAVHASDIADVVALMQEHGRGGIARLLQVLLDRSVALHARPNLTPAEIDVLRSLDMGRVPKDIAASTGRSIHTVRTLIQRATEKLGCSGRQEALATARRVGLLCNSSEQDAPLPERKASEL